MEEREGDQNQKGASGANRFLGWGRTLFPYAALLAGLVLLTWQFGHIVHVLSEHGAWVLALIPSVIGLANYLISQLPLQQLYQTELKKDFDELQSAQHQPEGPATDDNPAAKLWGQSRDQRIPQAFGMGVGVIVLAIIFALSAAVAERTGTSMGTTFKPEGQSASARTEPKPSAGAVVTKPNEVPEVPEVAGKAAEPKEEGSPTVFSVAEGNRGLVLAAFGAWVFVVLKIISRLTSSSISGKLLTACALRAGVALVFGFVAGGAQAFSFVNATPRGLVYFLLGLFPAWAMAAIARKAQDTFQVTVGPSSSLPTTLIDGIDEDVAERLAEAGVTEVQHLATSHPLALTSSTLFPYLRVLDWIDQSILLSVVRSKSEAFRQCGMRGAVDLAVLYQRLLVEGIVLTQAGSPAVSSPTAGTATGSAQAPGAQRAALGATVAGMVLGAKAQVGKQSFDKLAQRTEIEPAVLLGMCQNFYEDAQVNLIWAHWQARSQ